MKVLPLYLNGRWVHTETRLKVVNPSTTEVVAEVCTVPRQAVAQAVRDAHQAFELWRQVPGRERGEYLLKVADELERRGEEIAGTITKENGKPLTQSRGEIAMSVDHLRWFAQEARRIYGRTIPNQVRGKRHLVIKTPMGVVGAVSPWNFPLVLALRKVAPALAAGCTAILKPASATPLCALALAECMDTAKVPPGVFQIVLGNSSDIAREFLENSKCRKITFTGSTEVGKNLIRGAATDVKALSLELGGHAPVLVFEDADVKAAIEGAMVTKFRNNGQSCIAANRIYVHRSIYQQFLDGFVKQVSAMKVGDGFEDQVQIGPLINESGLNQAIAHVDDAVRRGARLLCGGKRVPRKGWFMEPTVLADVPSDAVCMTEETFAPVAPVCAFDTDEQAIASANATPYGLSAYAFTRDLDRTLRLMESLEAGTIGINDSVPSTSQCPFGGVKQSGWGRELGLEGLDAFLDTKHISIGVHI